MVARRATVHGMTILTAVIGGTVLGLMAGVAVGVVRKLRSQRDVPAQAQRDDRR